MHRSVYTQTSSLLQWRATASFTETLEPILRADGLDASNPIDVMTWIDNNFHHPADLGRAGVPDEIAKNYVWLYRQKRSAWTFEMDLRPWSETW